MLQQHEVPKEQVPKRKRIEDYEADDESSTYDDYVRNLKKKVPYSKVVIVDVYSNKLGLIDEIFRDKIIPSNPAAVVSDVYNETLDAYKILRADPSLKTFSEYEDAYIKCLLSIMSKCVVTDNATFVDTFTRTILMPYGSLFCALVIMYNAYITRKISYAEFRSVREHVMNKRFATGDNMQSLRNSFLNNYYLVKSSDLVNPRVDNDTLDLSLLEYISQIPKLMSIFTDRRSGIQEVSLSPEYDLRKVLECSAVLLENFKNEDLLDLNTITNKFTQ